jgi:energy-coupling factor transport system permease protein
MKNLEFFRNVSIGRYIGGDSAAYRLKPGTKYLWLLALMAPALAAPRLSGLAAPLAAALLIGAASGLKPGFLLRGVKPALPFFLLAALLQFLFSLPNDASPVLLRLGPVAATTREGLAVLMAIGRTVDLMVIVGLFTSVTSEGEIAHGLEDALAPFSRGGKYLHQAALIVSLSFRFIPIVAGELEAIVKAQASRGADFGTGRGGPLAKVKAYLPLFVPVTIRALERAELLAEAMESRCYTGSGGTRYVVYEGIPREALVRALALLFAGASLALAFLL